MRPPAGAEAADGVLHTIGDLLAPAAGIADLRQDAGDHLSARAGSVGHQEAIVPLVHCDADGGCPGQLATLLVPKGF